ncbi:MAG: sulfatase-like hydrolase/transferase [Deltaproteobacteria bacterium]|nr:sulfatase-like hydrolase/transferase [Deltaproteobacteria bacterium]
MSAPKVGGWALLGLCLLVTASVFGAFEVLRSRGPAATRHPNVVLVMPCTTRRDQFSVYGGPAGTTPFLDEVARNGVLFEDALAAAPWTMAGATAILTGQHAVSVGLVEPGPQISLRVLPNEVTTLAEHLQDRGYQTFGATANPNLEPVHGFDQGFDWYQGDLVGRLGSVTKRLAGRTVVDAVLEQLESRGDEGRPFYLQLMLIDTHAPLMPDRHEVRRWRERGSEACPRASPAIARPCTTSTRCSATSTNASGRSDTTSRIRFSWWSATMGRGCVGPRTTAPPTAACCTRARSTSPG